MKSLPCGRTCIGTVHTPLTGACICFSKIVEQLYKSRATSVNCHAVQDRLDRTSLMTESNFGAARVMRVVCRKTRHRRSRGPDSLVTGRMLRQRTIRSRRLRALKSGCPQAMARIRPWRNSATFGIVSFT